MFNSKIFNDDKNSNLNDIYLQPLSIRIAKRNKKLSEIKSDLDVRKNKIINYPKPKKRKKSYSDSEDNSKKRKKKFSGVKKKPKWK